MPAFAALPPMLQLLLVALTGCCLGAMVNWATYRFAWFNPRDISPWGPTPADATARKFSDRIPVLGWLGLRREHKLHGRGFWIRPLLIELSMGIGLAILFWWEVHEARLIVPLVDDWLQIPKLPLVAVVPVSWTHSTFFNHAVLITLMAAASFIDIDEKIIPDEITVTGTLLGLVLATLLPMGILAHVDVRAAPEPVSVAANLPPAGANMIVPDRKMYVEPATLAAPNAWPTNASSWQFFALGQACWWLWCFAMVPRYVRRKRGLLFGLKLVGRRIAREVTRFRPSALHTRFGGLWSKASLGTFAWLGTLLITLVWWQGGASWVGLLTSLVGLAVSGGLVWAVRLGGTAALNREAMGFGDVTLMMMVGTFLGWQAGIIIFFLAPFAGLFVGIFQAVFKRDDEIPYGPFLCLAAVFVMVHWGDVWNRCQFAFSVGWLVPAVLFACVVLLFVMLIIWQYFKDRFL